MKEQMWHAETPARVFESLHSQETGLASDEVRRRLAEFGPNTLPEPAIPGLASIFISQFSSPLIYVLLGAGVLVFSLGEIADGIIIFAVLLFNAAAGTIQEGKAQNTLAALRRLVETSATVIREGIEFIIPDREIVLGDIILLREGEKVPADARLIEARSLRVDEASFTGEPFEVAKTADAVFAASSSIHDRKNMVFKGSGVRGGNGRAIVVAVGIRTEIGKISQEVIGIDTDVPLKRNIRFLSHAIIISVLIIGAGFIGLGIWQGLPLRVVLATVVSLAVSIIPEGLPVVITLVLATGTWRMAKRNVLVKKLQAVDALGQAKIIAVDKTGTLTKNEMVVKKIYVNRSVFDVEGDGYVPVGDILLEGKVIQALDHPDIVMMARIAAFSTDAHVMYVENQKIWKVSGDPTEAALKVFSEKVGFKSAGDEEPRIFDAPFDYDTKYHATVHEINGKNFLTVVGAPEKILELSHHVWHAGRAVALIDAAREELFQAFVGISQKGMRIVAAAINADAPEFGNVLPPLAFVGFFGLKDPLREGVAEAIANAHSAGVRVVMITGDHSVTAKAIAKEAGLVHDRAEVVTGEELDTFGEAELVRRIGACNIFSRVTPAHKLKIIELFRRRGEVIAMTGDGVNDAPSLAAADLGVAMGKIGTEVAKEAADLVLLDDNFASITAAIEEGRSIYNTIKKVILYLFSTSIGEIVTISGALLLGLALPVLPAQIIWLNFITDGFLVVALAMEPKEKGLLRRRFIKPHSSMLDSRMVARMVMMGTVIGVGSLLMFLYYLPQGLPKAITVALTTLAVFQWFNAWNCKDERRSVFGANPLNNIFLVGATLTVIALHLLAVYSPFMQKFLHTVPLPPEDWFLIVIVSTSVLIVEDVRKFGTHIIRLWR